MHSIHSCYDTAFVKLSCTPKCISFFRIVDFDLQLLISISRLILDFYTIVVIDVKLKASLIEQGKYQHVGFF